MKRPIIAVAVIFSLIFITAAGCGKNNAQRAKAELDEGLRILQGIDPSAPNAEEIRKAEDHLSAAIRIDEKLAKAHCALGTAYSFEKQNQKALQSYKKALDIEPNYTVCLDRMGLVYQKLGEKEKAERYFLKAAATDATYADAHFNLAVLYEEENKNEQAVQEFESFRTKTKNEDLSRTAEKEIQRLTAGK